MCGSGGHEGKRLRGDKAGGRVRVGFRSARTLDQTPKDLVHRLARSGKGGYSNAAAQAGESRCRW
eukprot:3464771-Rhodomonas_salina.1